jgi:hypothetical protein
MMMKEQKEHSTPPAAPLGAGLSGQSGDSKKPDRENKTCI